MRGNRKHQTAAVRFGPALKALALCVFLGGSGVGYVWQKEQINILAERQRQVDVRYQQQRNKSEWFARVLAVLQTHGEIETQIKKIGLGLVPPQPDQILHIVENPIPAEPALRAGEALYAAGPGLTGAGRVP